MITKDSEVGDKILGYVPTEDLYKVLKYQGNEEAGDMQEFIDKYDERNLDLRDKRWEEPISITNAVKHFYIYTRSKLRKEKQLRRRMNQVAKMNGKVVVADNYGGRWDEVDDLISNKLREDKNEKENY